MKGDKVQKKGLKCSVADFEEIKEKQEIKKRKAAYHFPSYP